MTTYQSYFLVLTILGFASFGVSLAASCIHYRGWLARQRPVARQQTTRRQGTTIRATGSRRTERVLERV